MSDMKDAWARWMAASPDAHVQSEQVQLVRANMPVALLGAWVSGVIVTFTLWPFAPRGFALAWLAMLTLVCFLGIVSLFGWPWHWPSHSRQPSADLQNHSADYSNRVVAVMASVGALWGLWAWQTLATAGSRLLSEQVMIVALSISGMSAGGMAFTVAYFPSSAAFLCAALLPTTLAAWRADGEVSQNMSQGAFTLLAVLLFFSRTICLRLRSGIELQFKNELLLAQLAQESRQSQIAREHAEAANRAKTHFLAAASHDLRQPLHAMGLFVEALARSPLSADQNQVLTHLRTASGSASEMLNTLLDYSRLEAGAVQAKPKPFSLQNLLADLEHEFGMQADSKDLFYRSRETTLAAFADPSLVDLVLRNLISNALRYTREGGVLVACRKRGASVAVQVWDTGLGIARHEQQSVFEEFHQLSNPERDRQKGLGLGLAIVKRLCAQIHLRSQLGRGSMFELVLPLHLGILQGDVAAAPAASWAGLRVMVIDDEEPVRQGMQSLLSTWGCECESFESAQEALDHLAFLSDDKLPQVLISDYRLRHDLTGAQAIADVRAALLARGITAKLPAIIVTGDTAPERIREAQRTDALLLHKPVSAAALGKAMGQALV
jgi:signal transduction histidine kinase/CheY-like chemotaxis protein